MVLGMDNKSIFGKRISVVPDAYLPKAPAIKLSEGEYVSDSFRAEMDSWLLEMFGEKDQVIVMDDIIAMTQKMYKDIERQAYSVFSTGELRYQRYEPAIDRSFNPWMSAGLKLNVRDHRAGLANIIGP